MLRRCLVFICEWVRINFFQNKFQKKFILWTFIRNIVKYNGKVFQYNFIEEVDVLFGWLCFLLKCNCFDYFYVIVEGGIFYFKYCKMVKYMIGDIGQMKLVIVYQLYIFTNCERRIIDVLQDYMGVIFRDQVNQ